MAERLYQLGRIRFPVPDKDYRGWGWTRHGESKEAWGLNIGRYPGRKRYALYADTPLCSIPLAYFRSEVLAQLAMTLLDALITKHEPDTVQVLEE